MLATMTKEGWTMFDRQQVQAALLELVRERDVRRKYYPRAIAERKLSEREAKRRMDALEAAIAILSELAQTGIVQTDARPIPSSAKQPAKRGETDGVALFETE
jgi:hypothetical protein